MPRTHGRPGGGESAFPALAAWIRARMGTRSLGQVERDSGVSKSSLSEYRRGTSFPTLENIVRLASYFAVPQSEVQALRGTPAAVPDAGWTDAFAEKIALHLRAQGLATEVADALRAGWPQGFNHRRQPRPEDDDPAAG